MVQGIIGRIGDRKFGNKTFYSFTLNGQDGWYGTGVKRPPAVGTYVVFNEKTNAKGYLEVDGAIEIRTDGDVGSAPEASSFRSNGPGKSSGNDGFTKDQYWDRKESRDIHNDELREIGASRNTAIALIDLMIKHEAVKLPATAAKKEGFLWDLLNRYVDKLRGKTEEPTDKPETTTAAKEAPGVEPSDSETDSWN